MFANNISNSALSILPLGDFSVGEHLVYHGCAKDNLLFGNCRGQTGEGPTSQRYFDVQWNVGCDLLPNSSVLYPLCFVAAVGNYEYSVPSCAFIRNIPSSQSNLALGVSSVNDGRFDVANPAQMLDKVFIIAQPVDSIAREILPLNPKLALYNRGLVSDFVSSDLVSVSLGLNPSGASLEGSKAVPFRYGVATFTDLVVSKPGKGFTLKFTYQSLDLFILESTRFNVMPPVTSIQIVSQPAAQVQAGVAMNEVVLKVLDLNNEYALLSHRVASVNLTCYDDENSQVVPPWVTDYCMLLGHSTAETKAGVVKFTDLKLRRAGRYSLHFIMPWIGELNSIVFEVTSSSPHSVSILQQPCSLPCTAGQDINQVALDSFMTEIALLDVYENFIVDESFNGFANLTLEGFPRKPNVDRLLTGSKGVLPYSRSPVRFRFSDLIVSEPGYFAIKYSVSHDEVSLENSSLVFEVEFPVNNLMSDEGNSKTFTAGMVFDPSLVVRLVDLHGFQTTSKRYLSMIVNYSMVRYDCSSVCHVPQSCDPYNLTCDTSSSFFGASYVMAVGGVATFSDLLFRRAGVGYLLIFEDVLADHHRSLTLNITVEPGDPTRLIVARPPSAITDSPVDGIQTVFFGLAFGIQPVLSIVDDYGNIVRREENAEVFVQVESPTVQPIVVMGDIQRQVVRGQVFFSHLFLETTLDVYDRFPAQLLFTFSKDTTIKSNISLNVARGAFDLSILQPLSQSYDNPAVIRTSVQLSSQQGVTVFRDLQGSVKIGDACQDSLLPPAVPWRVWQAELRGVVLPHQPFVLTLFRPSSFLLEASEVKIMLVEGNASCDSYRGEGQGALYTADETRLFCSCETFCRAGQAGARDLYLQLTLNRSPSDGLVTVCAAHGGVNYSVPVVLHENGMWKLSPHIVVKEEHNKSFAPLGLPGGAGEQVLWYAGRSFDGCGGFCRYKLDPQVVFVLSLRWQWSTNVSYLCPNDPVTGVPYKWASFEDFQLLLTFAFGGNSSVDFQCGECSKQTAELLQERSLFLFSDSFRLSKAIDFNDLSVTSLPPLPQNVAGLVCVATLPSPTSPLLPSIPQGVSAKTPRVSLSVFKPVHVVGSDVLSPSIEFALDLQAEGSEVTFGCQPLSIKVSLTAPPSSWVRLVPLPSQQGEYITWPATSSQTSLGDVEAGLYSLAYTFGNTKDWPLRETGIFDWSQPVYLNLTAGSRCHDWPLNVSILLDFVLLSDDLFYSQQVYSIKLRRQAQDASEAARYESSLSSGYEFVPAAVENISSPPLPPPADRPFCIRAGAIWPTGGYPPDSSTCQGGELPCQTIWCGTRLADVKAGGHHSCALDTAKKLTCWGRDSAGQTSIPPTVVDGSVVDLDLGQQHTCAVLEDGALVCWGENAMGQTATPSTAMGWKRVAAGAAHSCGILEDGSARCWGDNAYLQASPPAGRTWQMISSGFFHSCGIEEGGAASCWGGKGYEQQQVEVPGGRSLRWRDICAGRSHSCGVLINGTLLCWGGNDWGQSSPPRREGWSKVSCGTVHSCGVALDGSISCWGSPMENRLLVSPRADLKWSSVSSSSEHSCALLLSGAISCWGSPGDGKLAVSAAEQVTILPSCPEGDMGVDCKSFVNISLASSTPRCLVMFSLNESQAQLYSGSFLVYKNFLLKTWVVSEDAEIAGGSSSFGFTSSHLRVTVGDPVVSPPPAEYVLQVEVSLVVDELDGAQTFFSLDGSDPLLGSKYLHPILLNSSVTQSTGRVQLSVISTRAGASPSRKDFVYVLACSTAEYSPNPVGQALTVVDALGLPVNLTTQTPNARIYFRICSTTCGEFGLYSSPFYLNQTGLIVESWVESLNLANSATLSKTFSLRFPPPVVGLFPGPFQGANFLGPLFVQLDCLFGSVPRYTIGGSGEVQTYTSALEFHQDVTLTTFCSSEDNLYEASDHKVSIFHLHKLQVLQATIREQTRKPNFENVLYVRIVTTMPLTVGTNVTLTSMRSTQVINTDNLQVAPSDFVLVRSKLTATAWEVVVTLAQSPPPPSYVFAVSNSRQCAERVPFISTGNTSTAELGKPHFNLFFLQFLHGGWKQTVMIGRTRALVIQYFFHQRCTLWERIRGTIDGYKNCRTVDWVIEMYPDDPGRRRTERKTGEYYFSNFPFSSVDTDCCLSKNDGAWGAGTGLHLTSEIFNQSSFWGQGVFGETDTSSGNCDTIYFGGSYSPQTSAVINNVLELTNVVTQTDFAIGLTNPAVPQPPLTSSVTVSGTFTDAFGNSLQQVAAEVEGGVLSANMSLEVLDAKAEWSNSSAGEVLTVSLQTDQEVRAYCQDGCNLIVALSEPEPHNHTALAWGSSHLPISAVKQFVCQGDRDCGVVIGNYLPSGAKLDRASLSARVVCSDFNDVGERVKHVLISGQPVSSFVSGPWEGCGSSCVQMKDVLVDYDVSSFLGESFSFFAAVSDDVDLFSCPEMSSRFRIMIDLRFDYHFVVPLQDNIITVTLRDENFNEDCVDMKVNVNPLSNELPLQCNDYKTFGWCDGNSFLSFIHRNFSSNLSMPSDVCCVCGGGSRWWTSLSLLVPPELANLTAVTVRLERRERIIIGDLLLETRRWNSGEWNNVSLANSSTPTSELNNTNHTSRRLLAAGSSTNSPNMCGLVVSLRPDTSRPMFPLQGVCKSQTSYQHTVLSKIEQAFYLSFNFSLRSLRVTQSNFDQFRFEVEIRMRNPVDSICSVDKQAIDVQRVCLRLSLDGFPCIAEVVNVSTIDPAIEWTPQYSMISKTFGALDIGSSVSANIPVFPTSTSLIFVQHYNESEIVQGLLEVDLTTSGFANFDNLTIDRACPYYSLDFIVKIGKQLTYIESSIFQVLSSSPKTLVVSPVPSVSDYLSPACSSDCPSTTVIAGFYFSLSAYLLDEYNNTCVQEEGILSVEAHLGSSLCEGGAYDLRQGFALPFLRLCKAANSSKLRYSVRHLMLESFSQPFQVVPSTLSRMELLDQVMDPQYAGSEIRPTPTLLLMDGFGNLISDPLVVFVSLIFFPQSLFVASNETNAADMPGNEYPRRSSQGRVEFPGLYTTRATAYNMLQFVCEGLTLTSSPIVVLPANIERPADGKLEVTRPPSKAIENKKFVVQPRISVFDKYGNLARMYKGEIAVSIVGEFNMTASLQGNKVQAVMDGVVAFSNLLITKAGLFSLMFTSAEGMTVAVHDFQVKGSLRSLKVLQEPAADADLGLLMPFPVLGLYGSDLLPLDDYRESVSVKVGVNIFEEDLELDCTLSGCAMTLRYRNFYSPLDKLESAFVDIDILGADFTYDGNIDRFEINGIDFVQQLTSLESRRVCLPRKIVDCFSYFSCVHELNVTELAKENYLFIDIHVSITSPSPCEIPLKIRSSLYGSYRLQSAISFQDYLSGDLRVPVLGRTVAFRNISLRKPGNGYRLIFSSADETVRTESIDINVHAWPTQVSGSSFESLLMLLFRV
eukprot:766710-Hanusia_phi.AAC.3